MVKDARRGMVGYGTYLRPGSDWQTGESGEDCSLGLREKLDGRSAA